MLEAEAVRTMSPHSGNAGLGLKTYVPAVAEYPANYYDVLGLDRFVSVNEVEKAFLRKIRRLLIEQGDGDLTAVAKQDLVSLFVARDVLRDPINREEHDFQLLSQRRKSSQQSAPSWKWLEEIDAGRMQIVEALMLAELATTSALQIALELHEPSSTEQFKLSLIEDGLVTALNLDSAILARLLLKRNRLRKASLKRIFKAMKTFGVDFIDSLLVTIDVTLDELNALARANGLNHLQESMTCRMDRLLNVEPLS